jgi:hypothetical protein
MPCGWLLSSAAMTSAVNTPRLTAIQETVCSRCEEKDMMGVIEVLG